MERRLFAGGNTADGFVNYYGNIVPREKCNALYVLKGGSGVGKSSFLKKVARAKKSANTEYFHCSSDTDSLDGLYFPDEKILLADGTAPHVIEPIYVGMGDKTVDLSVAIDSGGLIEEKENFQRLLAEKKKWFDRAYSGIKALCALRDAFKKELEQGADKKKLARFADDVMKIIGNDRGENPRVLFAGAMCAEGELYLESDCPELSVVSLSGKRELAALLLREICRKLEEKKIPCEKLVSPADCSDVYEIKLKNRIITVNPNVKGKQKIIFDVSALSAADDDSCVQRKNLSKYISECFIAAKSAHAEIEKIYTPRVNFDIVGEITEKIICEIK